MLSWYCVVWLVLIQFSMGGFQAVVYKALIMRKLLGGEGLFKKKIIK